MTYLTWLFDELHLNIINMCLYVFSCFWSADCQKCICCLLLWGKSKDQNSKDMWGFRSKSISIYRWHRKTNADDIWGLHLIDVLYFMLNASVVSHSMILSSLCIYFSSINYEVYFMWSPNVHGIVYFFDTFSLSFLLWHCFSLKRCLIKLFYHFVMLITNLILIAADMDIRSRILESRIFCRTGRQDGMWF